MGKLYRSIVGALALLAAACGSDSEAATGSGSAGGGGVAGAAGAGGIAAGATGGIGGSAGQPVDAGPDVVPKLGPPYPMVLAHGFFGFEEFAGVGFATYFYEVKEHLAAEGETLVYTPAVDPFNDSTYRGQQLIEHIEQILAETGHAKVNIIGHSQGGLDARVVAHDRPDLVASVTTYATPHGGTPIADVVLGILSDPNARNLVDAIVRLVGAPLYDAVGNETSLVKPMQLFSEQGIAEFNATYTDAPGVEYFSLTGRTDWVLATDHCSTNDAPPFVTAFATERDPVEPLLDIPEQILDGGLTSPYPNDGLVRVVDAKWGKFLGCVPADHLDEIGHLFGDSPGLGNSWRHKPFFVDLVQYLRDRGF